MPIGQHDVDRVLKVVRDKGLLPMPGGHGVWPILPTGVCSSYAAMFPLELRARSLVWMLADARMRWRDFRISAIVWLLEVEKTFDRAACERDTSPGRAAIRDPLDLAWRGLTAVEDTRPALPWSVSLRLLDTMYDLVRSNLTEEGDKKRLEAMLQGAKDSLKTIVIDAAAEKVRPLSPKANEGWAAYLSHVALNADWLTEVRQKLAEEQPAFPDPPGDNAQFVQAYGLNGDRLLDAVRLLGSHQKPHGGCSDYHWKLFNRACLAALDGWLQGVPGIPRHERSLYGLAAIAALPHGQQFQFEALLTRACGRLLRLLPSYIIEEELKAGISDGQSMPVHEFCAVSTEILPLREAGDSRPQGIPDKGDVGVAYDVLAYFHANRFDRWLAKAWRDAALRWFACHAPYASGLSDRDKCEAMLEALVHVGKPAHEAAVCARERIAELSMDAKPLPAALRQGAGNTVWQLTKPQRVDLNDDLRHVDKRPRLQSRLLIRLLLTRLGMATRLNVRPTVPARLGLYEPLRRLLANCVPQGVIAGGGNCTPAAPPRPALRQAIAHAPDLVKGIDLIVSDAQEWKEGSPGSPTPPPFALYDGTELPDMRALALEVDPDLRPGIEAVDLAAKLTLDVLLDPMHAGQADYFGRRQYNYLAGAIRGKESLHNYFAHLAQDRCATRFVVQAWVPPPGAANPSRCPLCRRQ